ncbi:MAG TPA: NUDIX hydrolase [Bacillota bacterium]|nr:NUDIX hydrolase [Bacillota bacterium]
MVNQFLEKTIDSKEIYQGKIISVHLEQVELPNGKQASREIVRHPGAVAIVAITEDGRIVMVRQFRKPLDQTIFEIPAGKLEKGEDPLACAKRELIEETGYSAQEMKAIVSFYTSPGFADEFIYIYEAKGLTVGEATPDEDEFVDLHLLTLEEAMDKITSGEIIDAKTVFAVYYWQNQYLKKGAHA